MNPDQVWQSVLGQLQMEMPKASFETWVRDTKAISLDDGVLSVGVRNAYARDWLESRLSSTVSRLLVGILNTSVTVKFVVANQEDEIVIAEAENSSGQAEISNDQGELSEEITLQDYDSAYERIVRPDRAVYLSGYFRRWLRTVGQDLGWMYVAFRQAAYRTGVRNGKATNRFSGKQLAKLAGITERTYWNRVENKNTWERLNGLVRINDHGPEWNWDGSTPKRLPRRYTVSMTLPLTPIDSNSLRKWLVAHVEQCGGPEGVLRAAADTPLDELIPIEARETAEPVTVRKLVFDLFGNGNLSDELLDSLASAIQTRLMPQSDLIVITLYFLENVLPHLGAGPAWMLTLLRDKCYVNRENGETRNRVTVQGGYEEVANWLCMSRPMTIWEWLHGKKAGVFREPVLQVYVREIMKDEKELDFGGQPRTFEVLLDDVPREILELALTGRSVHATFSIVVTQPSEGNHATFSIGFTQLSEDNHASFSIAFTRFSEDIHASCRVLSSLTLKPNPLTLKPTTTNSEVENEKRDSPDSSVVVDVSFLPSAWGLEWFFKINKTSQKMKTMLREVGATGNALVSWMLYASSTDPASRKLDDPYGFALSQLIEYPEEGKNENFDKLAALPPRVLVGMLSGTDFNNPFAWLFENLMIDPARSVWSGLPRYRTLLPILLGGKAVQEPTRKVETFTIKQIVHSK